ncbi:glycoside hydrolase superfamily, partial [Chytridium lagenaria]
MAEHVHWANKEDVIPPPDATQLPGSLIVDADEGEPIPHASPTVPTSKSPRSSIMKPIGNHDTPSFAFQMPLKDDSEDLPANPPPPLLTSQSSQYLGPSTVESSSRRRMLRTDGPWWTDSTGRTLMLRGVNVSGSAKLPFTPKMPSHVLEGFFDDVNVSFVGRPFPMDEADEHFARLRRWGFNFLRFNVAWEALEHAGPGIYDYEYMDYVVELLKKAKHYGLRVFIDPHQDVWSRFSGGSGAPGWTLRVAGLDATKFKETASAIVHNTYDDPENYPKMIWPTNYAKLACATMFTLFFGGKTFAPQCLGPDGTNIQDFLQNHYFGAFAELAKRIALASVEFGLEDEVVIGYDTLNEPHPGFIGVPNLSIIPVCSGSSDWAYANTVSGDVARVGGGIVLVSFQDFSRCDACAWRGLCLGETWTYFTSDPATGRSTDFLEDFWRPFVHRFTAAIRAVHRTAVIFIEPPVNEHPLNGTLTLVTQLGESPTPPTVFNRLYTVDIIGIKRGKYLAPPLPGQLNQLRKEGLQFFGTVSVHHGGDWDSEHALDINMAALETNMINFTLWNYCSDNSNKWGDGWNGRGFEFIFKADLKPGLIERAKEKKEVVRGRKDSTEKKKRRKTKNTRKAKSSTAANYDENTIDEEEVGNETSPEPAAMVDDGTTRVELKQLHRMRSDVSISSSKASTSTTSSAAAADAEARLTADEDYLDIGGRALRSFTRPYP